MNALSDKRMFERFACSMEGEYQSHNNSGSLECRNISIGGAQVYTPQSMNINDSFKLSLSTKNAQTMTLEAKVRWCRKTVEGWMAGIMFSKPLFVPLENIV